MLFKLSIKNMKKSFKDYTIYFLTLILGVAIFYMFNSLDSQEAMLVVSEATHKLIGLMIDMIGIISIFIAIILGFLIVYASNFLIKRRKKEFGIYMTLGMGKRQISKILLIETVLIGIISLIIGIVIGVFGSQFMSILIAKMFSADMTKFEFVFSKVACIKTCAYFGIMYIAVMLFNAITVSKYKLIDLINAVKKNEKIKIKNPVICIIVFIISVLLLSWSYIKVTGDLNSLADTVDLLKPIISGSIGTLLLFWSLSGFILRVMQSSKKLYLKGTNMFVLRQMNSKINTTVVSMTLICLMLFITICVLSTAVSLNKSLKKEIGDMTPVDVSLYKDMNVSGVDYRGIDYSERQTETSKTSIKENLEEIDYNMNNFKDTIDVTSYKVDDITMKETLGDNYERTKKEYTHANLDLPEEIIKVSDYNKIAKLYGIQEYSLKNNEFIIICNYDIVKEIRDEVLKDGLTLNINGDNYNSKYNKTKDGFILMSSSRINIGIILVPDSCNLSDDMKGKNYFIANYNANTKEEKRKIEDSLTKEDSKAIKAMEENEFIIQGTSKISIREASAGISNIVTFIALYLGIIFLISSSAILALKELSESSDNKQRYDILRKIGVDEKMINKTLFKQIGVFFMLPLFVAAIHSVFGIQFARNILKTISGLQDLTIPIIVTALFMIVIYGGYFIATYLCSKNIIKENN